MNAAEREQLFKRLYVEAFPGVARYIARRGGTFEAATDIFQDAVIVYYEQLTGKGVSNKGREEAYVFGIARHLWSRHLRQQQKEASLGDVAPYEAKEQSQKEQHNILHYISETGKRCLDLLHAFYYDKKNMKDIATEFGLSGERSATVQKYKCLEKVRDMVKEKALVYEDFAG